MEIYIAMTLSMKLGLHNIIIHQLFILMTWRQTVLQNFCAIMYVQSGKSISSLYNIIQECVTLHTYGTNHPQLIRYTSVVTSM